MVASAAPEGAAMSKPGGWARPLWELIVDLAYFWLVRAPKALASWTPFLSDTLADGAWTSPWRALPALAPIAAMAVGFLSSFNHLGLDQVYSSSLVLMVIVIASAILSGPAGLMVLVGYAAGDILSGGGHIGRQFAATSPFGPLQTIVRGGGSQLLSYLLLAFPAIGVPRFAAALTRSLPIKLPSNPLSKVGARVGFYPAVCALLVFLWCQGMTVLIRPLFTWRDATFTLETIATFQSQWGWLVAAAFVAALARGLLEGAVQRWAPWRSTIARVRHLRHVETVRQPNRWHRLPVPLRIAVPAGVTTFVLSGLYSGWSDAILVGIVTTLLSAWRVGFGGQLLAQLGQQVNRVSPSVRFVVALLVGYVGYEAANLLAPSLGGANASRPLLSGALLSLIASNLLFPSRRLGSAVARAKLLRVPTLPL